MLLSKVQALGMLSLQARYRERVVHTANADPLARGAVELSRLLASVMDIGVGNRLHICARRHLADTWVAMLHHYLNRANVPQSAAADVMVEYTVNHDVVVNGNTVRLASRDIASYTVQRRLELLLGLMLARLTHLRLLECILKDFSLSWDDLVREHALQHALPLFRIENWSDPYQRMSWSGLTDYEHACDLLVSIDPRSASAGSSLIDRLSTRYRSASLVKQYA